jgi:hypothetical protein
MGDRLRHNPLIPGPPHSGTPGYMWGQPAPSSTSLLANTCAPIALLRLPTGPSLPLSRGGTRATRDRLFNVN